MSVANKKDRDPVRLATLDLDGKSSVLTLKVDLEYWPTYRLRKANDVWERISTTSDASLVSEPAASVSSSGLSDESAQQ